MEEQQTTNIEFKNKIAFTTKKGMYVFTPLEDNSVEYNFYHKYNTLLDKSEILPLEVARKLLIEIKEERGNK